MHKAEEMPCADSVVKTRFEAVPHPLASRLRD